MTVSACASAAPLWREQRLRRCLAASLALVLLADRLFYDHDAGISIPIFLTALSACAVFANRFDIHRQNAVAATFVLAVALLPLVEDASIVSLLFGATGSAIFVLMIGGEWRGPLAARVGSALLLYVRGPVQLVSDALRLRKLAVRSGMATLSLAGLASWIIPILLCGAFLLLFASANPLIDASLSWIDPRSFLVSPSRLLLWLAVIDITWPFLHLRQRRSTAAPTAAANPDAAQSGLTATSLPDAAIRRSLLMFNALFAWQTALDLTYLWAGAALPGGITYADYAHRGAYPLMCTALLSAASVLIALKPGSSAERSPFTRALVFAWIGQNILLVISSILRLDLYVAAYSLTLLRAYAFVWMLLVAAGLALIVLRIAFSRSNAWLVRANLAAATIALYASCLINFPAVVASYNVDHCREISGEGTSLDLAYLVSLGPQAIPAIDRYLAQEIGATEEAMTYRVPMRAERHRLGWSRRVMAEAEIAARQDWRAWTFRDERLWRYLQRKPEASGSETDAPNAAIER